MMMDAATRGERLLALSERLKGAPVRWGEDDCSMMPAQWIASITGKEFDFPLYSSREEADAIIADHGGLVTVWSKMAKQVGLMEIINEQPQIGDVGIIMNNHEVPVGGIFLHGGVIMWRAEVGTRQIGVYGRTYPVRVGGEIERRPLLIKAWRV